MLCTEKQRAEYLYRSYTAVDGLWFRIIEDARGFDEALAHDTAVWRVMPKIQARKIKEMLGLSAGMDHLKTALLAKFEMEGYETAGPPVKTEDGWTMTVTLCPWVEILKKVGREHVAESISGTICPAEMKVWGAEFGDNISVTVSRGLCTGGRECEFTLHGD